MIVTKALNSQLPYLFGGEIEYLEKLAKELPDNSRVAIVGFGPGLMAVALYEAAGYNKFHMCAVDNTNFTGIEHLTNLPFDTSLVMIMEESHLAAELVAPVDAVFIDANHTYEYVKRDIDAWMKNLNSGGYVFFHDYIVQPGDAPNNGVKKAVDEWRNVGFEEVIQVGSAIVFRKK